MKSPMKFVALLVLVALMVVSPVLAQTANPLCNGLEAADCELMTAGETATSFSIPAWTVDLSLTTADGTTTFTAKGSGQFSAPASAESTEGLLVHLIIDEATSVSPTGTETGSMEILVLGDMIYIQQEGKWYGGTLEEAELPLDPSQLAGGAALDLSGLTADFSTSVTTARGEDAEMGGASVGVFTTTINLATFVTTLLADPAIVAMIPADQAESMQMVGMLVPMLLANTALTVEQSIGVDDGFVHKLVVDMPFDLDLSMMEMGQVSGGFNFTAEAAEFNSTFEATPPDTFEPLDALDTATTGM
jgi:hypothetical protein